MRAVVIIRGVRHHTEHERILKFFEEHRREIPDFKITVLCTPNTTWEIPPTSWVTLGLLGWEGSSMEMLGYTKEQIKYYLDRARSWGFAPILQPPNYMWDVNLLEAAKGWTIVHQPTQTPHGDGLTFFPGPKDLREKDFAMVTAEAVKLETTDALSVRNLIHSNYESFHTPLDFAVESPLPEEEQCE